MCHPHVNIKRVERYFLPCRHNTRCYFLISMNGPIINRTLILSNDICTKERPNTFGSKVVTNTNTDEFCVQLVHFILFGLRFQSTVCNFQSKKFIAFKSFSSNHLRVERLKIPSFKHYKQCSMKFAILLGIRQTFLGHVAKT